MNINTVLEPGQDEVACCSSGQLIPIDLAIRTGIDLALPVDGEEIVGLAAAHGRIVSGDICAGLPLPNFDNSAMDGYALNTTRLADNGPHRLKITGRMAAGDEDISNLQGVPEGALRILTGAPVPAGYDAVIMQEKCSVENNGIIFDYPPRIGANIRRCGEDCRPGETIISRGTRLDARQISLLAAQGFSEVCVRRKVRVAIFSTGTELSLPGQPLAPGQIYNSNRYVLASQLDLPFVEIIDFGTIKDDPDLLKAAMVEATEKADMVITTGGVSVGDEDHMPDMVTQLGGTLHITKVAIKPGKPVTIGTIGKVIYLGLPGNPVAAYINQLLIGRGIIEKLSGAEPQSVASYPAIARFSRKRSSGQQEYVPAQIVNRTTDGVLAVKIFENAGSAKLLPLARSDGFIVLPAGMSSVNPGDVLQFIPH